VYKVAQAIRSKISGSNLTQIEAASLIKLWTLICICYESKLWLSSAVVNEPYPKLGLYWYVWQSRERGSIRQRCEHAPQQRYKHAPFMFVWLAQLVKAPTLSKRACTFIRAWPFRRSEVQITTLLLTLNSNDYEYINPDETEYNNICICICMHITRHTTACHR